MQNDKEKFKKDESRKLKLSLIEALLDLFNQGELLVNIMQKTKKILKMLKMKNQKEKSFTLLELLVVIAVIAILAAIVLVSLSSARQNAWEARGLQFSQNIRTTLATDLVGEWTFDDKNHPETESSGNNIVCTVNGTEWDSNGKVRGARKFLGRNDVDYLNCNNVPILNFGTSDFTVEFWIKKDKGGKWLPGIVSKVTSPDFRIRYRKETNKNAFTLEILSENWIQYLPTKNFNIIEGEWQHGVLSAKRDTTAKFFVNGELKEEIDISDTKDVNISNSYSLRIG